MTLFQSQQPRSAWESHPGLLALCTPLHELGKGKFGRVLLADAHGIHRAVKVINVDAMCRSTHAHPHKTRRYLMEEIESMRRLSEDAGVLHVHDFTDGIDVRTGTRYAYIVTDFCDGGTLEHKMQKENGQWRSFSDEETAYLLMQLLDATMHMADAGVVHRDVKPENIFLQLDRTAAFHLTGPDYLRCPEDDPMSWSLVVGDFGMAKLIKQGTKDADPAYNLFLSALASATTPTTSTGTTSVPISISTGSSTTRILPTQPVYSESPSPSPTSWQARTLCGTPQYMAPEVFAQVRDYQHPVDAWAVGIVLYRLLLRQLPYANIESPQQLRQHMMHAQVPGPLEQGDTVTLRGVSRFWRPLLCGLLARIESRWSSGKAAAYVIDVCLANGFKRPIDVFMAMRIHMTGRSSVLQLLLDRLSRDPQLSVSPLVPAFTVDTDPCETDDWIVIAPPSDPRLDVSSSSDGSGFYSPSSSPDSHEGPLRASPNSLPGVFFLRTLTVPFDMSSYVGDLDWSHV